MRVFKWNVLYTCYVLEFIVMILSMLHVDVLKSYFNIEQGQARQDKFAGCEFEQP